MAQIVEVLGVGNIEFPDGMSKEQIGLALQKLPQPKFTPTPENRGNVINTDVPTVVGSRPNAVNPQPAQAPRTMGDYVKALYEVPATVVTGAVAPFIGVGAGMVENLREGTNKRVDRPELAQRFTFQPSSPVSVDALESLGGALDVAKIPAYVPTIGTVARATQQTARTTAPLASGNLPSFNQVTQTVKTTPSRIADLLREREAPLSGVGAAEVPEVMQRVQLGRNLRVPYYLPKRCLICADRGSFGFELAQFNASISCGDNCEFC